MKVGDLIKVMFPYDEDVYAIFLRPDGEEDDLRFARAWILMDGEEYSVPLDQMELVHATGCGM
jgi:hypothetical protein